MTNEIDNMAEQMEHDSRLHLRNTLPPEAVDDAVCKAGWFQAAVFKKKYENELAMSKHDNVRWKE